MEQRQRLGTVGGSSRAPGFLHHLALRHLFSSALVHQIVEVVLVNLSLHLLHLQDSDERAQRASMTQSASQSPPGTEATLQHIYERTLFRLL